MTSLHELSNRSEDAPSIHDLISAKYLEDLFNVTHRTIKRWESKHGWNPVRITNKIIRYHKSEVEKSLGVSLDPS
jgi:hypothetical protein